MPPTREPRRTATNTRRGDALTRWPGEDHEPASAHAPQASPCACRCHHTQRPRRPRPDPAQAATQPGNAYSRRRAVEIRPLEPVRESLAWTDLREVKREAARVLRPDHPLRLGLLAEPDALPASEARARLGAYLRVLLALRGKP